MKRICTPLLLVLLLGSCTSEPGPISLSVEQAGHWFLTQESEEFLHYGYDPEAGEYLEETSASVEKIRKLGAWWAMSELAVYTDDPEMWGITERGLDYVLDLVIEHETGLIVNFEGSDQPISANAFSILALLNIGGHEDLAMDLADAIVAEQESSGRINTFFNRNTTSNTDYYPGESMLAFMRLYQATEITAYKAAVARAFDYYAYEYWPNNKNTAFVPWQTQAYALYYDETHDPRVLDYIFEMNDYLLERYDANETCDAFTFKGNVTAVHIEGVNQAYRLAETVGDSYRATCYQNYIVQGLDFVMSLQTPEGAIVATPSDPELRVDQNQHGIMSMLGALKLGLVK